MEIINPGMFWSWTYIRIRKNIKRGNGYVTVRAAQAFLRMFLMLEAVYLVALMKHNGRFSLPPLKLPAFGLTLELQESLLVPVSESRLLNFPVPGITVKFSSRGWIHPWCQSLWLQKLLQHTVWIPQGHSFGLKCKFRARLAALRWYLIPGPGHPSQEEEL